MNPVDGGSSGTRGAPAVLPVSGMDALARALRSLPGVGPKAAQRMALHLLQHDRDGAVRLAHALQHAATTVRHCERCNTFTEDALCAFCRSGKRDPTLLCIVETPADLMMVEQTQAYSGLYYVLMGRLSPLDGIGPKEIRLELLIKRATDGVVKEAVLATNFTNEGEATAHYIGELLSARGPQGEPPRSRRAGGRGARICRQRDAGAGHAGPAHPGLVTAPGRRRAP